MIKQKLVKITWAPPTGCTDLQLTGNTVYCGFLVLMYAISPAVKSWNIVYVAS